VAVPSVDHLGNHRCRGPDHAGQIHINDLRFAAHIQRIKQFTDPRKVDAQLKLIFQHQPGKQGRVIAVSDIGNPVPVIFVFDR